MDFSPSQSVAFAPPRPLFSGHETFPLRYGWLKKVHEAVLLREEQGQDAEDVFNSEVAIGTFGVGKNMVTAMRYWALATGILVQEGLRRGRLRTTCIGRQLLSDDGWDPWLENPASLWYLHWRLCSADSRIFTWRWVFSHLSFVAFDRMQLLEGLSQHCQLLGLRKVAQSTLKRDIECLLQTYAGDTRANSDSPEDTLECPLADLGLIVPSGRTGGFQIGRAPRPTLPLAVFAYALCQYWQQAQPEVRTFSFESLMHQPEAPGRVFQLDEVSMMDMVVDLDEASDGQLAWSETAGLRQVICRSEPAQLDLLRLLAKAYV